MAYDWQNAWGLGGIQGISAMERAGFPNQQGGLLGAGSQPSGLLGRVNQALTPFGGMTNVGLAMLANSGYSPQKRSFGEILGTSMLQGRQMAQEADEADFMKRYREAQIDALGREKTMPRSPASVQEYEYAKANGFEGSFQDWIVAGGQSSRPSSVQEWEFYSKLPEEQKKLYLEMKRNPNFQVKDVGQVPTVIAPSYVSGTQTTPLSTLGQEATAASTLAGAKASGEATGKAVTEAKFDLPRVEANAQQTIDLLEKIKTHPGLDYGVGLWSKAPVVPGTPQADFVALTDQLQGKQFLEAYQSLKGGGQITEVEGTKAENAIARMQRAQSKKAFIEAATEFQNIVRKGVDRARHKAGASSTGLQPRMSKTINGKTYVKINGQWYEQ